MYIYWEDVIFQQLNLNHLGNKSKLYTNCFSLNQANIANIAFQPQ